MSEFAGIHDSSNGYLWSIILTANDSLQVITQTQMNACGHWSGSALHGCNGHWHRLCIDEVSEVSEVCGIAGEDDAVTQADSERGNDRVSCGNVTRSSGCGSHARSFAPCWLVDRADLAHSEQMVLVEVASVVAGENFDEDNAGHLWRPGTATAKFGQPCSLPRERGHAAAVEHEVHALRRGFRAAGRAGVRTRSAHAVAAAASSGPMGPSSASSFAR